MTFMQVKAIYIECTECAVQSMNILSYFSKNVEIIKINRIK